MEFEDTERFEIRRRLGEGGMGVVYEAWDREREALVALKTLSRMEGGAIYRLKREFRALADVAHPNLIVLHELFSDGDRWFFTMDRIEGAEFVDYVRDTYQKPSPRTLTSAPPFDWYLDEPTDSHAEPPASVRGGFDDHKLRRALAQLAAGVEAIHQAGKLHRDLKPSNVLVSKGGHLTILDFGVAMTRLPDAAFESLAPEAVGTPAYMAPEQAMEAEISAAADWYSVGVMLYQSLTGVLPFAGTIAQVVTAKQLAEPTHPGELVTGLPADLADLCVRLLARGPEHRADGAEVMQVVGSSLPSHGSRRALSWPPPAESPPGVALPFVGREAELTALRDAYGARDLGRPVLVQVLGSAGMGKTALVRRFLRELRDTAVIIAGRCYECESMPYKALDAVVDALARYLRRLSLPSAAALMPRDVSVLARLFPVLNRVQAVASAPVRALDSPEPLVLRQRGIAALKELLARIGDRHPLVLFIDDLQWGDEDSAQLLTELLLPPNPPALLLLVAYRHEEAAASPVLQALGDPLWRQDGEVECRSVAVQSLAIPEAEQLAEKLFETDGVAGGLAARIANESEGNPFFIAELVRHVGGQPPVEEQLAGVSLADVLQSRIESLGADERTLLEVVAVAGGPILPAVATRAAHLGAAGGRALKVLSTAAITRGAWVYGKPAIDVLHDRIRQAALDALSAARLAGCHERLAEALEHLRVVDPERLSVHLEGAGQPGRAAEFAARAAGAAATALAFDRAARLYRRALSLSAEPQRADWMAALGDALAHGGRSAEAAEAYLAGAQHTDSPGARDLRHRAAEHLLRCGETDRGLELMGEVLEAAGMHLASSPRRALMTLAYLRTRLRARGLEAAQPESRSLSVEQRQRMDTCWSVAVGLSMVDVIHGAEFHARHLLHALEAGEPSRLARALALEAGHVSSTGAKRHDRAEALLDRAEAIAGPIDDWHALGLAKTMRGLNALFAGQWRVAAERTDESIALLIERCSNVAWEIATARRYNLVALYYLGELKELARRVAEYLTDAQARGDRFAQSCVGSGTSTVAWLARDDPAGARAQLDDELAHSSERGFQLREYLALQGMTYVDLYEGRGGEAYQRLIEQWSTMRRSLLLRVGLLQRTMWSLRARAALATGDSAQLSEAQKYAARLDDPQVPSASAKAKLLGATIAQRRGATDEAIALYRQSAADFEALDMSLKAAVAAWRCGALVGGDEGELLVARANAAMATQGIAHPERMIAMIAPCGDPGSGG